MKEFTLSLQDRNRLIYHHRLFQAAVTLTANRLAGAPWVCEGANIVGGGVRVNGRDLALRSLYVLDPRVRPSETTPEEEATAEAIAYILRRIKKDGGKALEPYRRHSLTSPPLQEMLLKFKP